VDGKSQVFTAQDRTVDNLAFCNEHIDA